MKLRDYQLKDKKALYDAMRIYRRNVLQEATGAGKTHLAMSIFEDAVRNGKKVVFCCDQLSLIDQSFDRFWKEGFDVSLVQANNPLRRDGASITVASIQTLARREHHRWPVGDLYIVDECHVMHKKMLEHMVAWDNIPFIGLSATPFATGMGRYWDNLVVGALTPELMEQGWLSGYKPYGPSMPDLKGVPSVAGDYQLGETHKRMTRITGDIVKHYLELGEGRKTLGYAVNIAHARELAEAFNAAGIPANYVDGYDDDDRRHEVMRQFREGDITALFNCMVLSKGFDAPDVEYGILARPTKSLMLHIQQVGRFLRPSPTGNDVTIADHAGNMMRLGFPDDPMPTSLCMKEKGVSSIDKRPKEEPLPWNCPSCAFLVPIKTSTCPNCGHKAKKSSLVRSSNEKLIEMKTGTPSRQYAYSQLLMYAELRGYQPGWASHKYKKLFDSWPTGLHNEPAKVSKQMAKWIRGQQINEQIRKRYAEKV
jgi:superfamily II DNA or RNA helicase